MRNTRSRLAVWMVMAAAIVFTALGHSADAGIWLVSSNGSDQILKYGEGTGAFAGVFANASAVDPTGHVLDDPSGLAEGPDGNIYASYLDGWGSASGGVARFKKDGTFIDNFAVIYDAGDMEFGPDGHLYVSNPTYGVYRVKGPLHPGAGSVDLGFGSAGRIPVGTPRGIEILDLGGGNFDIFATSNNQIERYAVTGGTVNLTPVATYAIPSYAQGLEMGPDGRLYATSDSSHRVSVLDLPGGATAFALFAASGSATPPLTTPIGLGFEAGGNVLVNNLGQNTVARYSPAGAFLGNFVGAGSGGLSVPHQGLLNVDVPDTTAQLLVGNFDDDTVTRFNGYTGQYVDTFVLPGSGGLNGTTGIALGPDGNLYVASHLTHQIMRYDGKTGLPKGISGTPGDAVFVAANSGGLMHPDRILFLPDGSLLAASWSTNNLLRYGTGGSFMGVFAPLTNPVHMAIGRDYNGDSYQDLYATRMSGAPNGSISVFSLAPGTFGLPLGTLATGLNQPHHMLFIPDRTGDGISDILVGEFGDHDVTLVNGASGADLGIFGDMNSTYLYQPTGISFGLDGNLFVASRGPGGVGPHRVLKFDPDGLFLGVFINSHLAGPGTLLFSVPEPSTAVLLLVGSLGLVGWTVTRRRRK